MTDSDLIAKKLAVIETCLGDLATRIAASDISSSLIVERFAEHTLQMALQALQDVSAHIVSDERLGEPRTNHELIDLLAAGGWIPHDRADTLKRMVGFRNILVHGYEIVDPRIVRDVVEHRLGDLQAFVDAVRTRLNSKA